MFVRPNTYILAMLAGLAVVGVGANASAQSATTLHGVGSLSLAYTDNMFGSATHPQEGQPGPVGVWMFDVSPGARIVHESPRALYTLTYSHPITFYLGYGDATQHSDVGVFSSLFRLSPRDELTVGLAAFRSDTRAAVLRQASNQTSVDPQVTGENLMLQTNLTEGYSHEFSSQWRLAQRADFGTVIPLLVPTPQTYRYQFLFGGGPEFITARNAFGLDFDATYFYTTAVHEGGVNEDSTAQVVLSGVFRWRRDLSPTWSSELAGGIAAAVRTDPLRGGVFGPVGRAAIRYANDGPEGSLTFERSLGPNLVTASTSMTDDIRLAGGMPISQEHQILMNAGVGYAHSRAIEVSKAGFLAVPPFATPSSTENARLVTTFNSFAFDASVGWYPEDFLYFELRFQHQEQVGVQNQIAPAATFHRNLLMLTTGLVWPERDVPPVPAREPLRVDGADRDDRVGGSADGIIGGHSTITGGDSGGSSSED